ncbi:hypothetical protein B0I35DRAFT_488118 [Stachybotrys elegans]|uniref:Uncharacterized protein n=1 Tax=Stachybotrys elegans TaxID=80388 RepID=A0A8K0SMD6_9HYPO|nr:hypothetical protein B0I35DRAFT_488118 [Stachybotrys elegans]
MDEDQTARIWWSFLVVSGIAILYKLFPIFRRNASRASRRRLMNFVPSIIYGVVALQEASREYPSDTPAILIACERLHGATRSRTFFCMILLDSAFIGCFATALGLGSRYTTFDWGACSTDRCRRSCLLHFMGLLTVINIAMDFIIIAPLAALPSTLSAAVFLIAEPLQLHRRRYSHLEKPIELFQRQKKKLNIASLFLDDNIAAALVTHLHFAEVAKVALTSKSIRGAVLQSGSQRADHRKEMLCETACDKGTKTECWACARLICLDSILIPRTESHIKTCFAVCTHCYLFKKKLVPASRTAAWAQNNLASQHNRCGALDSKASKTQILCSSCALLPVEETIAQGF